MNPDLTSVYRDADRRAPLPLHRPPQGWAEAGARTRSSTCAASASAATSASRRSLRPPDPRHGAGRRRGGRQDLRQRPAALRLHRDGGRHQGHAGAAHRPGRAVPEVRRLSQAGKVMPLDPGMKFKPLGMNPRTPSCWRPAASTSRNLPLVRRAADPDRPRRRRARPCGAPASSRSCSAWLTVSLQPELERIEQAIEKQLLTPADRGAGSTSSTTSRA
jgi:hypothetical protein